MKFVSPLVLHFSDEVALEKKLRIVLKKVDGMQWMTPRELALKTRRTAPSISRAIRRLSCPVREWKTGPSGRIVRVLVTSELLKYLRK